MSMLLIFFQTAQNIGFSQVNACCLTCENTMFCALSLPSHFFYSLIRNLFLSAQNIVFSQVSATFVLPIPETLRFLRGFNIVRAAGFEYPFPNSHAYSKLQKTLFSQVNAACVSRPIFFPFPNSQLIPTCAKHCVFTGRCACLSRPIFSYSLIHDLFV